MRALPAAVLLAAIVVPSAAATYGPQPGVTAPPDAVILSLGDDVQASVDSHPPGTTFFFGAGTYRLQSIQPKNGDVFLGKQGATLNGAKLLTAFEHDGPLWVARDQPIDPDTIVHGECRRTYPRCDHPQDLYFDGQPLRAVANRSKVTSGTFFYDYRRNELYFADDPTGHIVELSHRAFAFGGTAANVTVQNLTIENYAAADQRGAINNSGHNWTITNNLVQWNHGYGVVDGSHDTVTGNAIVHNGEIGIGGGGFTRVLIQNNEIAYNVWNGTDCQWECGGAKWAVATHLRVIGNYVHDNQGDGLWTDIDCSDVTYDGNTIERNLYAGISHEISGSAIIRNNLLRFNGARTFGWGWQGQIQIQNSSDVKVYRNTLVLDPHRGGNGIMIVQQNRGDEHMPHNNTVHDNDITMAGGDGAVAGWFADYKPEAFPSANNLYDRNHYHVLPSGAGTLVWSVNDWVSFDAWQASGQDAQGTRDAAVP